MGITGFAFQNDSVCFTNRFVDHDPSHENPSVAYSLKKTSLTPFGQAMFAKYLTRDYPFDLKIDNLKSIKHIVNLAFASILDDDPALGERPIGVLHLFNKPDPIT